MSRAKLPVPGSPFQFRSPTTQILPMLKGVKVAKLILNPSIIYKNVGFVFSLASHLEGRVSKRLCPKAKVEFERTKANHDHAVLSVEYTDGGKKDWVLDKNYRQVRDLALDMHRYWLRDFVQKAWIKSMTYMTDKGDAAPDDASKKKKADAGKGKAGGAAAAKSGKK